MKIQTFIFMLTFVSFALSALDKKRIGIDLELDEGKIFEIRNIDEEPISYWLNYNSVRTQLPKKYFDLIKQTLIKNNFKCYTTWTYSGGFYEKFYCKEKSNVDFSKVKLHLHFENSTITMTEKEIFEIEGSKHVAKFLTQKEISMFIFGLSKK